MPTDVSLPGSDLTSIPLVLGGNTFGWTSSVEESFAVLDAYLAAGGRLIDTADSYAMWGDGLEGGDSERVLGAWMRERGTRDQVLLATKVGGLEPFAGQSREKIRGALAASLERLGTDHVDLYYAHYDDESVEIAEQVAAYDELVREGRIRAIGLSNFTPERMRAWFQHARDNDLTIPAAIQVQYNLLHRSEYESAYRAIAEDFGAQVFPYFTLASGLLTGKYRERGDLEGAARAPFMEGYLSQEAFGVVDELVRIADARSIEPATAALAWLLAKGVSAPIASARTVEQLPALTAAARVELSAEEVAALDDASASFA